MSKKKKIVIAVVGFALAVLLGLSVYQSPAYKKNLAELEQVCAELTKNDPDGRVYEPIVGQYKWKSYSTTEHVDPGDSIYAHKFTLKMGNDEIAAYSSDMGDEEFFSEYLPIIKKRIVGFSEPDKSSEYSKEVYGVCAYPYKNPRLLRGQYINKIETLMLVKE